jgi:DNA-binding transcriptional regulator LsrR (DeoR family)
MIEHNKRDLIYKIARDYYQEKRTQQEIANKLGISRIMVSRLLARAVEERIVEIRINIPDTSCFETERQIEERFGLSEAIVVACNSDEYDEILKQLGAAAVDFLFRNLKGNETISISWGYSLLAMINAIPRASYPKMTITQMIGGLGFPEEHMSGTELVRRISNSLNAGAILLNSPGIVKERDLCVALKDEPQVNIALEKAKTSDMAFVGIGHFGVDSPLRQSGTILSPADLQLLDRHGAVGDISLRFFNEKGAFINGEIDDRVVGLSIEEIRNIPRVAGIAGGKQKWPTIRAALETDVLDILITDDKTARELLIQTE